VSCAAVGDRFVRRGLVTCGAGGDGGGDDEEGSAEGEDTGGGEEVQAALACCGSCGDCSCWVWSRSGEGEGEGSGEMSGEPSGVAKATLTIPPEPTETSLLSTLSRNFANSRVS
jgi:hypothetical protein